MYRPGRFLLYLLIAAHVAAAGALVALAFESDLRTHSSNLQFAQRRVAMATVLGVSYAQTALAVWWTVMGRSLTWPTRAAALIGVCTIWARVMTVSSEAPGVLGWGLYVGMTVALLWMLVPWRMVADATRDTSHDTSHNTPGRWQFELRQLLMLLLAAACTFTLARWWMIAAGSGRVPGVWLFSLSGAATATVALWACHRKRGMFWRSPAMLATVATVTLLMWWQGSVPEWWYYTTTFAAEAITIAATMAVLHIAARQPVRSVTRTEPGSEPTALRDPQFG